MENCKSILLIDTPENCTSCQMGNMNLHDMSKGGIYCQLNKKEDISWENAKKGKPDWCPLQKLPEKKYSSYENLFEGNRVNGWNDCIDEILRGGESNETD